MSRTIKRGPPPRRPVPRGKRKVQKSSILDRGLAAIPVSETTLRKAVTTGILLIGSVAAIATAIAVGVPSIVGAQIAEGIGRAGFRVDQIEITGLRRMDRMSVYAIALDQQSRAMPLVDLDGVRQKLLRYGWIAEAHVSRRYPDTLLVDIVERQPAAVWQDQGQLTLIDKAGVLLEPVDPQKMPDLPLVIGPGADRQTPAYQALIAAAPALRPRVRAAAWIGNRRWDLTFDTGETLALPQDDAAQALVKFAQLDGARALLGKGWLRFDMRDPARLVARKPGQGSEQPLDPPDTTGTSAPPIRIETAFAGDTA